MKIMIALLFGFVMVGRVLSDSPHNKDVYGGKRDDDHGANIRKNVMTIVITGKGVQYVNNVGPASHYVLAPAGPSPSPKYELSLAYAPNNYRNPHVEAVPYPGVYHYPSKMGPIQYAVAQHQQHASYQQPIHMIVTTYHSNPPAHYKGVNVPVHHGQPNVPRAPVHQSAPVHKYSPAQYNTVVPVHIPPQHHAHRHQPQSSALVPIAVPLQHIHHQQPVSHALAVLPSAPQQNYYTTSAAAQHQQHEEQHAALPPPQPVTTAAASQPTQQYISSQSNQNQGHQQQHYTYSIQPSVQISASKQIVAPAPPTPQYKQENYPTTQYSNDAAIPVQQVYYPTPSTPVYSTAKPYVMVPVQPTGPGGNLDYTSAGAATLQYGTQLYHQPGGKTSAVSAAKYA
ncbi:unnamed protein product [Hermetia illucens]|uniref:Uncharacterized protein n=1 Tax=Hermetia illucens TaxID=343691 RepID=A0A7R8UVM6_HERIL|nr:unnamed protein product [Hermetia illucens]